MKKITILALFTLSSLGAFAQTNDYIEISREVLKTEKKAMIAEVMQLNETESTAFWPLYNEYEQKKYEVNTRYIALIKEFADNYEKMSAEVASTLISNAQKIDMDLLKLEKTYSKKFMKVLSPQKTLKYLQAENKIRALIDAEIALEIPLLEEIED